MSKKQATIVLNFDGEISALQGKLNAVKASMEKAFKPGSTPAITKSIQKVEEIITNLQEKTKNPIGNQATFGQLNNQIAKAKVSLEKLENAFGDLKNLSRQDKLEILPEKEQKKINDAIAAIGNYASSIGGAVEESAELVKKRKELAAQEKKIAEWTQKQQSANVRKKGATERKKTADANLAGAKASGTGDLEVLEKAAKEANNEVNGLNEELTKAQQSLERYQDYAKRTSEELDKLNKEFESQSASKSQEAYDALRLEAEKLGISLKDIPFEYTEQNAEDLQDAILSLVNQSFKKADASADKFAKAIKEGGEALADTSEKVEGAKKEWQDLSDSMAEQKAFEERIKQFVGLAGATELFRNALRNAWSTIQDLDAVMTEMAVVTDLTVGDYWDQLPEYSKRASDLGVSIHSAYEAATLYYQQGLNTNEVVGVSTETLKMARIAGLSAEDATNKMTAA